MHRSPHARWTALAGLFLGLLLLAASSVRAIDQAEYLVLDLKTGAMEKLTGAPSDLLTNPVYKETRMVFRRIPAGTVVMNQGKLEATISKDFHLAVFECTQAQWETTMGANPSKYQVPHRPVEGVAWEGIAKHRNAIRGQTEQMDAPAADSFLGKLRALGKDQYAFDLPTECQWELACRAGSTTDLNNGTDLSGYLQCAKAAAVARYDGNRTDGKGQPKGAFREHTAVGSYQPNAWGLYDMLGNVWELCLDWRWTLPEGKVTDYLGSKKISGRTTRGGSWRVSAWFATVPSRDDHNPKFGACSDLGLRVAIQNSPVQPKAAD